MALTINRKCGFIGNALCHCEPGKCPISLCEETKWDQLKKQALSCEYLEWAWPTDERRISSSEVKQFKSCRVRWFFSSANGLNRAPKIPSKSLWLGKGIHIALAAGYSSKEDHPLDYLSIAEDRYYSWLYDEMAAMEEHEWKKLESTATLGETMLEHYALWAPKHDDFKVIGTEMCFRVPLPSVGPRVSFVGRIDGLVERGGAFWILENKTAGRFPNFDMLAMDGQGASYVWAMQRDPNFEAVKPKGIIYNFLLKKEPYIPKLLSSGKLEMRSNMNTSVEVYLRELERQGLRSMPYRSFLNELERKRAFFKRVSITYSKKRLKAFQKQLNDVIKEMVRDPPVYPKAWRAWDDCSRCEYRVPCELFIAGGDYRAVLDAMFVENRYQKGSLNASGE